MRVGRFTLSVILLMVGCSEKKAPDVVPKRESHLEAVDISLLHSNSFLRLKQREPTLAGYVVDRECEEYVEVGIGEMHDDLFTRQDTLRVCRNGTIATLAEDEAGEERWDIEYQPDH